MRDDIDLLYQHIAGRLKALKSTIAVAESVTGGLLQHTFTSMENASQFFQGGITVYNLGQKVRHLSVEPIHAATVNAVSQAVADQMALQVRQLFVSECGIGITGYASLEPPLEGDLFAFFAIARKDDIVGHGKLTQPTDKSPAEVQQYYVEQVLSVLSATIK